MKKLLTIAIPVYNMEKYLARCLDSVVSSKYLPELEVLVVNDGSKDRSLEIAQEFEKKFPDSVSVIDKPNGGWGTAINMAVKEAKGKYYKSLDSDDWFDTAELDKFVEEIRDVEADMILSSYTEVYLEGSKKPISVVKDYVGKTLPFEKYLTGTLELSQPPIHGKCYRTKLLRDNAFKVADKFYGDIGYNIYPLKFLQTVHVSDCNVYQYQLGREGQSVSMQGYVKNLDDYLNVISELVYFLTDNTNCLTPVRYEFVERNTTPLLVFGYKLLMKPELTGKKEGSKKKLIELDRMLKDKNPILYKKTGKAAKTGPISWLSLWRKTGLNLFALRHN